jgi:REP element-mobilizing transposase RayT
MLGVISDEKPKIDGRGGAREGAGRKRSRENKLDPTHETRPVLNFRHPVHITMRVCDHIELRQRCMYKAIRSVLVWFLDDPDLRVIHISIQNTHIHMIVESPDEKALSRGMQCFATNTARAINTACGWRGKVFKFRYAAQQIRTRSYARNAISYVLNNWRKHGADFANGHESHAILDEYSSAISFVGWVGRGRKPWSVPGGYEPLPVSQPRTSLLKSDWQWHGLIDPWEIPGPSIGAWIR